MQNYKLYSVNSDGSKTLVAVYNDLVSAQAAMIDNTLIYSIEWFQDPITTVLF